MGKADGFTIDGDSEVAIGTKWARRNARAANPSEADVQRGLDHLGDLLELILVR
jgi:hypothetical protein